MDAYRMYVFAKDLDRSYERVGDGDYRAAQGFLEEAFRRVAKIVAENVSPELQEKVLADLLVVVFKAPFYSDPIDVVPGEGVAAFTSPYNYFLSLYVAYHFRKLEPLKNVIEHAFSEEVFGFADPSFLEKIYNYNIIELAQDVFNLIKDSIREESGYWSLFKIPQDTRPGLNFGLIPHMLLTSAILWSVLYERSRDIGVLFDKEKQGGEERSSLRLAALAHDIGKVFDYTKHVEEGASFFERLARETGYNVFAKISELVRRHHERGGPISRLISEADRAASALDRNADLAKRLLGAELERLGVDADRLYGYGREAWEEFKKIADVAGDLTRSYVEKRSKGGVGGADGEELGGEDWDVYYLVIDVGGIQSLIKHGSFLQTMVGASFLVDLIVTTIIPYIIVVRLGVPPENIVVSSGGNVGVIIPKSLLERARREVRSLEEKLHRKGIGLRLYTLSAPLVRLSKDGGGSYRLVWRPVKSVIDDISRIKLSEKYLVDTEGEWISDGLALWVKKDGGEVDTLYMCESCGVRPATHLLKKGGETYELCETCKTLFDIGYELVFKGKFRSKIVLPTQGRPVRLARLIHEGLETMPPEKAWDIAGEKILEFVAGHSFSFTRGRLKVDEDRKMNIAVVAADGDDMGGFFSDSTSFAEFYEKSLFTDLALKKAIREFSEELIREMGEELGAVELSRILFGFLYVGGDDLLGIVPAYMAVPYAVKLSLTFREVMRGKTLSIGVASAKYDHPIWLLIEAARRLEREAKEGCKSDRSCGREFSSISFVYLDQGLLSGLTSETIMKRYREMGFTNQPLRVGGDRDELLTILRHLGVVDGEGSPSALLLRRLKEELSQEAGKRLKWSEVKKTVNYYRKAWNYTSEVLGEVLEALKKSEDPKRAGNLTGKLVRITVARNIQRASEAHGRAREAEKYYRSIEQILLVGGEVSNPFADVYMLYKLIGGGLR